ncbi:Thymosin beta-b [Trichoplax sp. H2]|nr:Thymosin beta-b [Trichoplax sp. H2]|eukprot:RDD36674.1 Thymosin beta-b [Trichoplax sp. H2]
MSDPKKLGGSTGKGDLSEVAEFDKSKLKKVTPQEKNTLPTKQIDHIIHKSNNTIRIKNYRMPSTYLEL